MGDILKFFAGLFLISFLLIFTIPLLWGAIKLFLLLFGGIFVYINGWLIVLIISIIDYVIVLYRILILFLQSLYQYLWNHWK